MLFFIQIYFHQRWDETYSIMSGVWQEALQQRHGAKEA